jgi:hypothetical protein
MPHIYHVLVAVRSLCASSVPQHGIPGDDERMGRYSGLGWTIVFGALALLLAPVVVLAGEPALRRHRRGWHHRRYAEAGPQLWGPAIPGPRLLAVPAHELDLLLMRFGMHPLVIAMTAPARWVRDRMRHLLRRRRLHLPHLFRNRAGGRGWGMHERLFPDDPPFLSGVREPRRPKPSPPHDAIALEPPTEHSARD